MQRTPSYASMAIDWESPSTLPMRCACWSFLPGATTSFERPWRSAEWGTACSTGRVVETRVWFRPASREELERYVAAGESDDKAGAYGVQGLASGFVTRLEGSYTNVVGLPAAEVVSLLVEHGALEQWP